VKTTYLFSSPDGDLPLLEEDLDRPFLMAPGKVHPFLTLGDYFQGVEELLLDGVTLEACLPGEFAGCPSEIKIRSEKHGAFYHIASADLFSGERLKRICVTTALTERGRNCLAREFSLLLSLGKTTRPVHMPRVYGIKEIERRVGAETETFTICLSEWLEDYHEWHLTSGEGSEGGGRLCIWDLKRGIRYASERERYEIFRQAARILTSCYDANTLEQISAWHHAAGDFVVRRCNGVVDLKLTTVRGYEPLEIFSGKAANIPYPMGIVFFFLDTALRIRLDKENGTGKVLWAEEYSTQATVEGFFDALTGGNPQNLLSLLRSFDEKELLNLYHPLRRSYERDDPEDLSTIDGQLPVHVMELCACLKRFCL
jgi:hypothetical protein